MVLGVVNIITRSGEDLEGAEVVLGAGSEDTGTSRFSYGDQIGNFEFLLSGTFYKREGEDFYFPEFDEVETNNGRSRNNDEEEQANLYLDFALGNFSINAYYNKRIKYIPTGSFAGPSLLSA